MRSNSVASIVSPYEHYWTLNPEQGSHDPVLTQIRMHKDATEIEGIPTKK